MASPPPAPAMSFSDFPEDIQLNILSFLSPTEIFAFASTSRRFAAHESPLWLFMCERRWGFSTRLRSWSCSAAAGRRSPFARLYKALDRWEDLIGFWRRIGPGEPRLVLFEWGPSYIVGSRVSPSTKAARDGYGILKLPFLWLGLSSRGEPICFLHPGCRLDSVADLLGSVSDSTISSSGFSDPNLVPVTVSFMGCNRFVLEENWGYYANASAECSNCVQKEVLRIEGTSPPDRLMSEIYQHFANLTRPIDGKATRRQRKKEKERFERGRRWHAEYFVKICNCYPTPERPLQGLWKGISEDRVLEFYLVAYDDIGGITCQRVGEVGGQFLGYSPVFWTSNTRFPREEQDLYGSREHIRSVSSDWRSIKSEVVVRILHINSGYVLVIPSLSDSSSDTRNIDGRIWEYDDGTFGFGFLRNDYIIDLKHVTLNGSLLDTVELPSVQTLATNKSQSCDS
ncbi:F-Box protein [Musa troglodytarum]|uniref:F-Box protein n=1 Tax=Musa troglodytarum TaxID=320322 RepID=A0A9E7L8A5_9LILI|nr:F-Box protein [Musa troglodytarum]URE41629.1 F-Box protein [Musa troglodytarum]URE41630.1 F-Box protein [Musa troglodytarum]